jgi:hypothetical protein
MFVRTQEALLALSLVASLTTAARPATIAENPFIGEWKLDSSKSRMPDEMKVESKGGNKYVFDFGGGAETIIADGTAQPALYGTLVSAKAEAADTWIVERKKDGRLMLKATWKLSADGSTLTDYYREFAPDGSTISMDYVYQRNGPHASNESAFAADWQSITETINTPYLLDVKPFQGDGLSFIDSFQHATRNVKFDGKDYPDEGPNAQRGATSSIRKVDDRNLLLSGKSDGKVTVTEEIGLSADHKILTITVRGPGRDKPSVMVFHRK